ncbi:phage head morphogenesis protein [Acetobacter cibinongensis]|uniref:phage head morphogenesis protein n=1 Tax=Acetobacter cibinongensis TaxID=146475 RepID=UPI000A368764|nr:phage minor head protein [Acetobacter cibinongensis]
MADSIVSGVGLAPKDAISFFRSKVNRQSASFGELEAEAHARSFSVAGAMSDALLNDFRKNIDQALRGKVTLAQLQKEFPDLAKRHGWEYKGKPGWRAMIIYQTNLSTAYAAGQYRQLTTPEALDIYPYWRYRHHACQHPRPQHLAWDGLILPADDPFWATHFPPNGWHCHCTVEPVSRRDLKKNNWVVSEAPILETRPWKNPVTGQTVHVPVGIDPGFQTNPGLLWARAEKERAETALVPALKVAGKSMDELPPAEQQAVQAEQIGQLFEHPVGVANAGTLPTEVQSVLKSEADTVLLSDDNLKKNMTHHAEITLDEYLTIPQMIAHPQAVLDAGENHVLLLSRVGKQLYRMIVKTTMDRKENWLLSLLPTSDAKARGLMRSRKVLLDLLLDDDGEK